MSPIPLGIVAASAGGAAASYELIETVIIPSSGFYTANFNSLDTIAAGYKHLQIRSSLQATSNTSLLLRFNGDSGNNYSYHAIRANGSTLVSYGAGSSNSITFAQYVSDNTLAVEFAASVIDILDFSNPLKNTTARGLGGSTYDAKWISLASGAWYNTSPVTRIELTSSGSALTTGSRFSLYGIKGE